MNNNNYVSVGNIIEQERLKRQAQIAKGVGSDVYDHIEKAHQDDLSKGIEMTDNLSRFADDVDNLNKAETEFLLSKLQRQIVVDPQSSLLKSFKSIAINHLNDLEKAWNVGDEKQYLGVTWYVGGFNAKGQPLWRKKKDGGDNTDKKAGASTAGNSINRVLNDNASGFKKYHDDDSNETWYEGQVSGKRVRILQETVGKTDWWNVEVDGKYIKDSNDRAMTFQTPKDALDEINEYVGNNAKKASASNTPASRKPGSTDEIERMTAQGVRSSILGLNNIATNVKDNGDHFKIDFDANDFNTNGKRSPQIDRIAKFLESMGASCVIGSNSIKAYKKVETKKNTTNKTQSPQDKTQNSGYSDLTFDEAVKIGKSNISDREKSSIENTSLRYLQEDIKNHKYDDDIKYQENELRAAVNMKIGDKNFMAPNHIVTPEFKSEEIKKHANRLAEEKEKAELCKRALAKRKAEKKQFLDSSGNDFTEDEARLYISKFRPKDEPNAVVKNTWNTLMGRIGSTSATISVGKGKFKEFSTYDTPDWRPLGVYSYSTRGWDGKYITITGVVQSWKEVKDCLSDTENMTISIYKHPKQ